LTVSATEVERRVSLFAQALRSEGFRVTHQRLEVAYEIARSDSHPDVETIYRGVRERIPTISLDTVYRTLGELERLGLVRRVIATPGPARYDANQAPHHHFVCDRCGLIRDLYSKGLDSVSAPDQTALAGRVEGVEVRFHGVCHECTRKE
jgi:Fur family transcriptional regulator, peroxide stress response regulator